MSYKILVVDTTDAGAALKTTLTPESSIADATAITGGESPTEAEHNALVTKINAILDVLDAAGLTA
jgi:hypothetical protein